MQLGRQPPLPFGVMVFVIAAVWCTGQAIVPYYIDEMEGRSSDAEAAM